MSMFENTLNLKIWNYIEMFSYIQGETELGEKSGLCVFKAVFFMTFQFRRKVRFYCVLVSPVYNLGSADLPVKGQRVKFSVHTGLCGSHTLTVGYSLLCFVHTFKNVKPFLTHLQAFRLLFFGVTQGIHVVRIVLIFWDKGSREK